MRKCRILLCGLMAAVILCLYACGKPAQYIPSGEFYAKTSPANGDTGASYVVSLEAASKTYEGDGDITVPFSVGFGHHPHDGGYGDDINDTFYVLYRVFEAPYGETPAWEKKVEYTDSFYDAKYDSTEQKNSSILFVFPVYGEFYPLYKDDVEIVFPAGVEKGKLDITIYSVIEGREDYSFAGLTVRFTNIDGVLTLEDSY